MVEEIAASDELARHNPNRKVPTLVDDDLTMSSQFGVSAFPFWVVTDGDGTVLFRTAGLLPIEQVEAIAGQLEELAA